MAPINKQLSNWVDWAKDRMPAKLHEFLKALWEDWGARMSGIFSVPFVAFAAFSSPGLSQTIWVSLAILSLATCVYRLWISEHEKVLRYAELIRPKLECALDPKDPGCVRRDTIINVPIISPAGNLAFGQINATYFRLRASASNMATVKGCQATLTRITRDSVPVMQGENIPLPFAHSETAGRQVNALIPEYIDLIAITADNQVRIASQGLVVPNSIRPDQLFTEIGHYRFRVVIACEDGPPIEVEPVLNWTGNRESSSFSDTGAVLQSAVVQPNNAV